MANQPDPFRDVVVHLVRLIQDSPDVRHYVGGPHTQMRELLLAAIKAGGYSGDPLDVLKPAPHHADDEPAIRRRELDIDRLENGLELIRAALRTNNYSRARDLVERLQSGESVTQ